MTSAASLAKSSKRHYGSRLCLERLTTDDKLLLSHIALKRYRGVISAITLKPSSRPRRAAFDAAVAAPFYNRPGPSRPDPPSLPQHARDERGDAVRSGSWLSVTHSRVRPVEPQDKSQEIQTPTFAETAGRTDAFRPQVRSQSKTLETGPGLPAIRRSASGAVGCRRMTFESDGRASELARSAWLPSGGWGPCGRGMDNVGCMVVKIRWDSIVHGPLELRARAAHGHGTDGDLSIASMHKSTRR